MTRKEFLKMFYWGFYRKFFPNYKIELKKAVDGCKTLLDVGCGSSSPIKSFSDKMFSVGVDIFGEAIEKSKRRGIHDEYYKIDALNIEDKFEDNSFDCVLASDLIEHLTKERGEGLIEIMEKIAKKKVIIFTPNGFLKQEKDNNPFQEHKSGWDAKEMKVKDIKLSA